MKQAGVKWVHMAGAIAVLGALVHVAAILGGPAWYAWFDAPPFVVESARRGTWLAPVSAAAIAALMALCAAYAFSAAGAIRRLPLLRLMLGGMAAVCLLRALVVWPLLATHPELRNLFTVVASLVWGLAGAGFAVGCRVAPVRA
jgi:hypothetical protein